MIRNKKILLAKILVFLALSIIIVEVIMINNVMAISSSYDKSDMLGTAQKNEIKRIDSDSKETRYNIKHQGEINTEDYPRIRTSSKIETSVEIKRSNAPTTSTDIADSLDVKTEDVQEDISKVQKSTTSRSKAIEKPRFPTSALTINGKTDSDEDFRGYIIRQRRLDDNMQFKGRIFFPTLNINYIINEGTADEKQFILIEQNRGNTNSDLVTMNLMLEEKKGNFINLKGEQEETKFSIISISRAPIRPDISQAKKITLNEQDSSLKKPFLKRIFSSGKESSGKVGIWERLKTIFSRS